MGSIDQGLNKALDSRYFRVLSEITSLLLRDCPVDEVCEAVFSRLRSVLQLDAYFHFRVTIDGTRMRLASCRGCPPERLPDIEFLEFGQAVCGTVAARRRQMYVPHVLECRNDLTEFIHSIGITCYACQPLIVNGRLLGTFSFGTKARDEYTDPELQLIELVCHQVAIAASRDMAREQQLQLERLAGAGYMAAKIAHEINNPLAAATNLLYLAEQTQISGEGRELVKKAQEQLNRVANVAKQTLSYYRESRPLGAVDLRHAIDVAVSSSMFAAQNKRLEIKVDTPRSWKVQAHDGELVQILTNLLANAIHHSPEGESVNVTALSRNSHVNVFVSDKGPGISPEIRSKIFEPFFTTNKQTGNGLGLWISKELARRMDAVLLLAPSSDGATFELRLHAAA